MAKVIPRFEPGALSISINKGPVAFCTASVKTIKCNVNNIEMLV